MPECINCKQEISEEQFQQFKQRCPSCFSTYELEKSKKWIRSGIIEMVAGAVFATLLSFQFIRLGVIIMAIIFVVLFGIVFLEGLIRLIRGILKKQQYSNVQPSP